MKAPLPLSTRPHNRWPANTPVVLAGVSCFLGYHGVQAPPSQNPAKRKRRPKTRNSATVSGPRIDVRYLGLTSTPGPLRKRDPSFYAALAIRRRFVYNGSMGKPRVVVSGRVLPDVREAIVLAAKQRGVTPSEHIGNVLTASARRSHPGARTGAQDAAGGVTASAGAARTDESPGTRTAAEVTPQKPSATAPNRSSDRPSTERH